MLTFCIQSYHSGTEMVSPQSGQQLHHRSTHLLQLPPQGEAECMFVVLNNILKHFLSSISEYALFKSNLFSIISGPKPTQKQLLLQLYNTVPDKWHPIGIYLEIPEGQLNAIDVKHRGDPQKCLLAMLTESWLPRVPPPTWAELAEAVEFVGYPDVAQKLREKFSECHANSSFKCN